MPNVIYIQNFANKLTVPLNEMNVPSAIMQNVFKMFTDQYNTFHSCLNLKFKMYVSFVINQQVLKVLQNKFTGNLSHYPP